MGNHGYITLKKDIALQDLEIALKEIVEKRFNNRLYLTREEDFVAVWIPRKDGEEDDCITSFFLSKDGFPADSQHSNVIEFNHTNGGDPLWWVELILSNQLGHRFDGMLSDDGIGDKKWKPDIEKYRVYRDWAEWWKRRGEKPTWNSKRYAARMIKISKEIYGDIFAEE